MSATTVPGEPVLREVKMHLRKPTEPVPVKVVRNELCTANKKAAGFVRHIEFDVTGTELEGQCVAGQSVGVVPPGVDAQGRAHKVRLYSLASPTAGEDGKGRVFSTTVKRTIDENWETHKLFLGVASNFLSDAQVGDTIMMSGPNGKRFVLPADVHAHDYLFLATGTGIAPYRGMLLDLFQAGYTGRVTLVMGAPYATDLLYHDQFLSLARQHSNFTYLTAISRETQSDGHDRMYVQDRLRINADDLLPQLSSERNLVYICGIAGMELGILQQLALVLQGDALSQYLQVDPSVMHDIRGWDRRMLHKEVRPTRRMLMEVYA